jgi:hypothetical protein
LSLVAILVIWLPWTPVILYQAKSGGMQWMQAFWENLPPALAIPKSLLAFIPGTFYPIIMRPLPHAPSSWMWLAVVIYGASFVMAFRWSKTNTEITCRGVNIPKPLIIHGFLAIFLFCPLLLIWIYSSLFQPIYLVGRSRYAAEKDF